MLLLQDLAVILCLTVLHGFDGSGEGESVGIASALAKMPIAFLGMAVMLGLAVLACAALVDVGASPDGLRCGELAAFCVSPEARGSG